MRFAFAREGWADHLHQHVMISAEAASHLAALRGRAGLVFIDGLHTYAGVLADFNAYAEFVAVGGAILFHDVAPEIHSVFRVIVEHVLRDERFKPMCLVDGLLVLERNV